MVEDEVDPDSQSWGGMRGEGQNEKRLGKASPDVCGPMTANIQPHIKYDDFNNRLTFNIS